MQGRMQSWADIASDSDDDEFHPANKVQQESVQPEPESEEEPEPPPEKEYNWPAEPPFTAYVGNLAFNVKDSEEMSQGVTDLLRQRFQTQITIVNSRLAIDRHENKPRGFGYLEVETLQDLKTLLRLNDGQSMMKGRPLKLDVAQPPSTTARRGGGQSLNRSNSESFGDVDGKAFQGGRFSRQGSSNSSLQRQSSAASQSSEPRQRPSLKLAPRSKPRDLGKESTASSLFGEGKKRDGSEWERGRESSRGSGRGGGGGRGTKGRGEGNKGRGDKQQSGRGGSFRGKQQGTKEEPKKIQPNKEHSKKPQPASKKETDAPKPALQAQPEPAKPATAKVQNKFAALDLDSDSD